MTPREIDSLVAEKVMEWTLRSPNDWLNAAGVPDDLPPYSDSIASAWQVVEKMEDEMGSFTICPDRYGGVYSGGKWVAHFGLNPQGAVEAAWGGEAENERLKIDPIPGTAVADTPPMAICLAALKAKGVEV